MRSCCLGKFGHYDAIKLNFSYFIMHTLSSLWAKYEGQQIPCQQIWSTNVMHAWSRKHLLYVIQHHWILKISLYVVLIALLFMRFNIVLVIYMWTINQTLAFEALWLASLVYVFLFYFFPFIFSCTFFIFVLICIFFYFF